MKIKVGKRYVARNGEIVSIVKKDKKSWYYPFQSDAGMSFDQDGFYYDSGAPSEHDLIAEFKDHGAPGSKLGTILAAAFWWAMGICLVGILVMLVTHWGPVVFPGG